LTEVTTTTNNKLEKTAQGVDQCEVSATHVVVSATHVVTPRFDVLERADTADTKVQISPLIVNGFKNGFYQWIQHIFLVTVEQK